MEPKAAPPVPDIEDAHVMASAHASLTAAKRTPSPHRSSSSPSSSAHTHVTHTSCSSPKSTPLASSTLAASTPSSSSTGSKFQDYQAKRAAISEKDRLAVEAVLRELKPDQFHERQSFTKELTRLLRKHKSVVSKLVVYDVYCSLVKEGKMQPNPLLVRFLAKKEVRSSSGVIVITVLTKPFFCPGKCVYCPTEPDMPKSYLSDEPAAARAKENEFDACKQMFSRLTTLDANGHPIDKLEVLVLGGSWSAYPLDYQEQYIRDLYYSANVYFDALPRRAPLSLEEEQTVNETAKCKIIGLTLETRPDLINAREITNFRRYGCTRVQLGIQHTDDHVLKVTRRGHTLKRSVMATRMLKEAGFKVDHHYMPNSPGSTLETDLKMFQYVFASPDLQPDQVKIYPCIVNKYADLHQWWLDGKFQVYSDPELIQLLIAAKQLVPPYVRINRIIRDFTVDDIQAGTHNTNLRQVIEQEMAKIGKKCRCIRCREVRGRPAERDKAVLKRREYVASQGREIFFSLESADESIIYGFLRLRFNANPRKNILPVLRGAALIRELHVYGYVNPVHREVAPSNAQHLGFGARLLKEAEIEANKERANGVRKLAVISGVGVRNYYKKFGYHLEGTYMVKVLEGAEEEEEREKEKEKEMKESGEENDEENDDADVEWAMDTDEKEEEDKLREEKEMKEREKEAKEEKKDVQKEEEEQKKTTEEGDGGENKTEEEQKEGSDSPHKQVKKRKLEDTNVSAATSTSRGSPGRSPSRTRASPKRSRSPARQQCDS